MHRKAQRKAGFYRIAVHMDRSTVHLHDGAHDGQAQAARITRLAARRIAAVKGLSVRFV